MGGMLRELREETGTRNVHIVEDSARLTGYFRWISRAAKPEFTGIVRLSCDFATLRNQSLSGTEKAFTQSFTSVPLQLLHDAASEWTALTQNEPVADLGARRVESWATNAIVRLKEAISHSTQPESTKLNVLPTPTVSPSCEFSWLAAAQFLSRHPRYFEGLNQ
jgi:hypothetical protein